MNKYNLNFSNKTIWAVCFLCLMLVGCSTLQTTRSPNFYPNQHLKNVGQEQARHDTRVCNSFADEYVKNPQKWKNATKNVAKSTIVGSAVGAASGALFSNAGRGVAAGAIGGVIVGCLLYTSPSPRDS